VVCDTQIKHFQDSEVPLCCFEELFWHPGTPFESSRDLQEHLTWHLGLQKWISIVFWWPMESSWDTLSGQLRDFFMFWAIRLITWIPNVFLKSPLQKNNAQEAPQPPIRACICRFSQGHPNGKGLSNSARRTSLGMYFA
jgi:hypothetical protein